MAWNNETKLIAAEWKPGSISRLMIGPVAFHRGEDVFLNFTIAPSYKSTNLSANVLENQLLTITMACGTSARFNGTFWTATNSSVALYDVKYGFFDLDTGRGKCRERVVFHQPLPEAFMRRDNSSVVGGRDSSGNPYIEATSRGTVEDNPDGPSIDDEQKKHAAFIEPARLIPSSRLEFTLSLEPSDQNTSDVGFASRRFMFTGETDRFGNATVEPFPL